MSSHLRLFAAAAAAAAALTAATAATAHAASVTNDFETPGTYDLLGTTVTTAQSQSPTHSIQFSLPDASDQIAVRVAVAPGTPLKLISGAFSAYVPAASGNALAPYMYLGVDSNNNGAWDFDGSSTGDSLVLAFSGGAVASSFANDTWFTTGIDQDTNVHVVGGRQGLATDTFVSTGGHQDTVAHLDDQIASGSLAWGDLNVLKAYAGAGAWPGATNYVAFADDLTVTTADAPAAAPVPAAAYAALPLLALLAAPKLLKRPKTA